MKQAPFAEEESSMDTDIRDKLVSLDTRKAMLFRFTPMQKSDV